jgi:hypothetical protein
MIRSTLSFCALFAALILGSKLLQESNSRPPVPKTLGGSPAPQKAALKTGESPASTAERIDPVRPTKLSQSLASPVYFISHDDPPAAAPRDPDDNDAPPRPTRELEDLLNDDAAQESPAAEKPTPLESTEPARSAGDEPETTDSPADKAGTDSKPAESTEQKPAEPTESELTPELAELRDRVRQCLAYYYFRPENVATRSPWGAMHWMIAYGVDAQLIVGPKRVNAVGYLNYNGVCNGQRLFYTLGGRLQAQVGVGVQGHAGQYLAMLAQSRVKTDYPMLVDGQKFTVADLIEHEKLTCRPASELTFKLIALSHYLKSDEKWVANDGQQWDIPRLIKEELAQPINGAACGGTHRMTGFSYAVRKRQQRGEPIEGQWLRAKKFVEDFHEYTFKLQNPDGSFSTEWFVMRADYGDIGRRLQTTGHITEWLAFSLTKEQLVEPRMTKSVSYLTNLLLENRNEKWSIGPLGHGLHALAIYDERVFGGKPGTREQQLAEVRRKDLQR